MHSAPRGPERADRLSAGMGPAARDAPDAPDGSDGSDDPFYRGLSQTSHRSCTVMNSRNGLPYSTKYRPKFA